MPVLQEEGRRREFGPARLQGMHREMAQGAERRPPDGVISIYFQPGIISL